MTRDLKRQAGHAVAAAYVTERALQKRYPCPAFQVGFSDVQLSHDFVAPGPRSAVPRSRAELDTWPSVAGAGEQSIRRPIRLISVGTFEQLYKGPDVLVDAVGACIRRGLDLALCFVGGGAYLEEIRRRAERLRIGDRVRFEGYISSRPDLVARLDASDLFVLPSRQEGLPRAMIEAMARGLPCIGSDVGGIPELLDPQDLVPSRDAAALACKIEEVLSSPARLVEMSRRSVERARNFVGEGLAPRRTDFYRRVLRASSRRILVA
jgi:glycosyltransferase involved in cell wall biosynthesis